MATTTLSKGQITITDFTDPPILVLSPSSILIPSESDGSYTGSYSATATVYVGGSISTDWTFTKIDGSGITSTFDPLTQTVTVGEGGLTLDSSYIDIVASKAEFDNLTIRIPVVKLLNGANGTSPVVIDLTNDNITIPTNTDGSGGVYTNASTSLSIFSGLTEVIGSLTSLTVAPSTGVTFSITRNGVTTTGHTTTQSVNVVGLYSLDAAVSSINTAQNNGTLTFTATYGGTDYTVVFTVSKAKAGADGTPATVYEIEADKGISYDPNTSTFTPASVVYSAFSATGTSVRTAYNNANGTIRLESSVNGSTWTTLGTDLTLGGGVSTRTLNTNTLGTTVRFVRATLLVGGTIVDQETDALTVAGAKGDTGNSAALFRITNTGAVFVKKKDGTFAPTNIVLNTTYQNITGTITYQWYKNGVVISGATSSSYTVPTSDYSAVSSNTYKCVITGTINGVAGSTLNDSIVIPKQDEATENPSVLVSDNSITFTAPNTGYSGISFTSGSVEITAYIGSTKCDFAASGANTFSVGTLVLSGVTGVTGSGNTTTDVYTVSAPTAMSADSAYVDVPITIRGPAGTSVYNANTRITYSLSRTGGTGGTGPSGRNAVKGYQKLVLTSMPSAPAVPNSSTTDPRTSGAVANAGVWYTNPPTSLATNEWLFEMDGFYDGTTYTWTNPSYLSTFKVGKLEALTVNTGSLTVDGDVVVGSGGTIKSTGYSPGSAGWAIKNDGTAEFAASSIRGQITASQINSNGLSIKDTNGNVILAAGTPLDSANYQSIYNFDFVAVPANALVKGNNYVIETPGSTSWTSLGSSSNSKNTIFTAIGAQATIAASSMSAGVTYEIVTVGTTDFTAVGANANKIGARFTATGAGTGTGTVINTNIGYAVDAFIWQKGTLTITTPTSDTGYIKAYIGDFGAPFLYSYSVNFKGKDYNKIRARVRRTSTTTVGTHTVYYRVLGGHDFSGSYYKVVPDTTVLNEWVILEWDMANLTLGGSDWTNNIITGVRLDILTAMGASYDIDWISIGRYGPLNLNSSNADTYIANLTIGTLKFQEDAVSDSIESVYTNAVIYNSATGVSSTGTQLFGPVITPVSSKAFVIWFNGTVSQINGAYQVGKNVFASVVATAKLINLSKGTSVDIVTQKQQIPVPESQSYENSFSVGLAGIYEGIIPKDNYRLDIYIAVFLNGTYMTPEAAITSVKFSGLGQIQEVKV